MIEVPYVNWRLYLDEKYQTKIKTTKKQKKSETHSGVCGATVQTECRKMVKINKNKNNEPKTRIALRDSLRPVGALILAFSILAV